MNATLSVLTAVFALLSLQSWASPLDEARVNRVVNAAEIAGARPLLRPAAAQAVVHADERLRVAARSRVEIGFADGTLGRLGAETELGFRAGTRELTLERGTLLLEVPALRGGARIHAGALSASSGAATFLIEYLPAQSVKVVVLAGDLRVSTGGFFGDSIVIPPGKMLIVAPDAKLIPDPVDVDLRTLVKTSALVDAATFSAGSRPLASLPRIEREIARQEAAVSKRRLIPTNLAIIGSGTSVVIPGQPVAAVGSGPSPVENRRAMNGKNGIEVRKSEEIAIHSGAPGGLSPDNQPIEP